MSETLQNPKFVCSKRAQQRNLEKRSQTTKNENRYRTLTTVRNASPVAKPGQTAYQRACRRSIGFYKISFKTATCAYDMNRSQYSNHLCVRSLTTQCFDSCP